MKHLFHLEDRKLFISMIALSLIALLAAVLITLVMTAYTNQALKDTYAGIVGTVAQKYPQAEAQVVQDLRAPGADFVNLGYQVLGKYGLDNRSAADTGVAAGLLARLLPVGLALVGLACARVRPAAGRISALHLRAGGGAFGLPAPHRCRRLCPRRTRQWRGQLQPAEERFVQGHRPVARTS